MLFKPPSISERCSYDNINYIVVLVSSTGERVDQRTVSSDFVVMISVSHPSPPPPQTRPIMSVSVLSMSLESQVAHHL